MDRRFAGMLAGAVISVCLALSVFADGSPAVDRSDDTDSWVGKQVMVIHWNADFKVGSKVVGRTHLGDLWMVSRVNGDWLWIKQVHGWIDRSDVVVRDRAIEHFTAAIRRNPTAEAYHQRALARVAVGQYRRAVADFESAIRSNPRKVAVYNDRGNVFQKLGLTDRAIADFNNVIAGGVRHPGVYTNRGLAWYHKRDYERALADFNAAIALDARFAPAWEAGGTVRAAQGNYAKAIDNFKQAIKSNPKFVRAHNNLAWIFATCPDEQFRDAKQAIKHAMVACEQTQFRDFGYLDTLAATYAEAGQFDKAVERATQAMGLAPNAAKSAIAMRRKLYMAGKPYHERAGKK